MSLFPASVSANKRYILDQNGNPWMIHGEAGWEVTANLSLANAQTYLDDRASRGVNLVLVMAPSHLQNPSPPNDASGNAPFTGISYQSALGSAYWSHVGAVIDYAATKGITVVLFPSYLGFSGTEEGWDTEIAAATNAQVQQVGNDLGTLFKTKTNLIWSMGGDLSPSATLLDRVDHLVTGIKAAGDTHLITAHDSSDNDAAAHFGTFSWLDLNSVHVFGSSGANVITDATTAYNRATTRPTFQIEGTYQHNGGVSLAQVRREAWQIILVGGLGGHIVGNESIWSFGFNTGFSDSDYVYASHYTDQAITDSGYIRTLFDAYPTKWSALAPDLSDTFLTAGEGSGGTTQAAASYSTDIGLVYLPAARNITCNMAVFTGHTTMRARWYDPTAGTYTAIGSFAASGSHTFTHPGNNSKGDADWVLVIDDAASSATPTNAIAQATAFSTKTTLGPTPGTSSATALANVAATTIKSNSGSASAFASPSQINIGAVGPFTRLATATTTANQPAATVSFHAGFSTASAAAFAASVLLGAPTFGPFNALVRFREPDTIVSRQHHPLEG